MRATELTMISFISDVTYKSSHCLAQRISDQSKRHYSLDYCISFAQLNTRYLRETRNFMQIIRQKNTTFNSYLKMLDVCYISHKWWIIFVLHFYYVLSIILFVLCKFYNFLLRFPVSKAQTASLLIIKK